MTSFTEQNHACYSVKAVAGSLISLDDAFMAITPRFPGTLAVVSSVQEKSNDASNRAVENPISEAR